MDEIKDLQRKIVPESLRTKAGFAKDHNRPYPAISEDEAQQPQDGQEQKDDQDEQKEDKE